MQKASEHHDEELHWLERDQEEWEEEIKRLYQDRFSTPSSLETATVRIQRAAGFELIAHDAEVFNFKQKIKDMHAVEWELRLATKEIDRVKEALNVSKGRFVDFKSNLHLRYNKLPPGDDRTKKRSQRGAITHKLEHVHFLKAALGERRDAEMISAALKAAGGDKLGVTPEMHRCCAARSKFSPCYALGAAVVEWQVRSQSSRVDVLRFSLGSLAADCRGLERTAKQVSAEQVPGRRHLASRLSGFQICNICVGRRGGCRLPVYQLPGTGSA